MASLSQLQKQVTGIPMNSTKLCLPDPATQYQLQSSSANSSTFKHGKQHLVLKRVNKLGKKADNFANGIREHVRLGPKITETVKGKLSFWARILQNGGVEKAFKKTFCVKEGERLVKACECYLSTTAGPIAGILFISTEKIAFCSERSIKLSSPDGELLRARYKVVIPIAKIKRVNQSENVKKPSQKYMEVVTVDGFDFWFMGFLNYQKALKYINQAITSQDLDGNSCGW